MADDDVRPPVDRFTWERALKADPEITGTRLLVLLTVATCMDANGTNARPSQATIAEDTGLKDRAVRGHLSWAVANGWLVLVQRGHRIINSDRSVASLYRACTPQPAPPCRLNGSTGGPTTGTAMPVVGGTSGTPEPVVADADAPQPARNGSTTGTPVPPTTYQEQPSSHEQVTNGPPVADEKHTKITPTRIFSEMARRRLFVGRRESEPWAPPEGCDPRREKGWLQAQAEAFKAQHGFKLDTLLARHYRPGGPAKFLDPDWYVFHLDRDLAKRDWTQPTAEETRAKLDQERTERAARAAAMTPEDREAAARARDEARRRIAEINRRSDEERHLHLVVEAS
jgi:hypothetical protein